MIKKGRGVYDLKPQTVLENKLGAWQVFDQPVLISKEELIGGPSLNLEIPSK